jgi:PRTRC genetic system protein B
MNDDLRPLVQINCYADITTLTRYESDNRVCTYRIELEDLAMQLNHVQLHSGFLPSNVLAWGQEQQHERVVWYVPRGRYDVLVRGGDGEMLTLQIPLPATVLSGCRRDYHVYAVKQRPTSPAAQLYHFPAPNVAHDGNICRGTARFPAASIATLPTVWQAFVTSAFTSHWSNGCCKSEPQNVLKLWQKLHDEQAKWFPKRELVKYQRQLHSLL